MRYYAQSEGSNDEIELEVDENGAVAEVGGAAADLVPLGGGRFSLLLRGRSYELYAVPEVGEDGQSFYRVDVGGQSYRILVQSERERRIRKAAPIATHHSGAVAVKAPMPGLVTGVVVSVGEVVQSGQRLILLEAMKMENEIRAPKPGTVKSLATSVGDKVEQGRVLLVIE